MEDKIKCGGEEVVALYEGFSDSDGYYYCSKCGKALDDHK